MEVYRTAQTIQGIMNPRHLRMSGVLAIDTLRRYPDQSVNRLAKYLLARHPGVYTSFESARTALRMHAGLKDINSNYPRRRSVGVPVGAGKLRLPQSLNVARADYQLPRGTWGIMCDVHVPFHELKPIETAVNYFKQQKITGIIMSDAQDCEALSYWRATRQRNFLKEVEAMADFLNFLRQEFPKTQIIWQRGNHEERVENYYRANAPMLADLPTAGLDQILALETRKVDLLEPKQKIVAHELTILHGHEMRGGFSVVSPSRWALLKAKSCVVVGHFHQTSETTETSLQGTMLSAWSVGCLCDLMPDYNPYGNRWNWGCAVLHYPGSGWEMENRKILNNGKLV